MREHILTGASIRAALEKQSEAEKAKAAKAAEAAAAADAVTAAKPVVVKSNEKS